MSNVDADTANWRLFGGGGLAVGGLLLLIHSLLPDHSDMHWLETVGFVLAALGFFFVAWGQTGSNGAVGASLPGKLALGAAASGTLLAGIAHLLEGDTAVLLYRIGWGALAVGALAAAVLIYQRGVAKGLAKFALFAVALFALLFAIGVWVPESGLAQAWVVIAVAVSALVTGVLYVLNGKFAR